MFHAGGISMDFNFTAKEVPFLIHINILIFLSCELEVGGALNLLNILKVVLSVVYLLPNKFKKCTEKALPSSS